MRSGGLCVGGNQSTRRKPVWLADHMTISHGEAGYWTWVAAVRGKCVTTVPARQQHSIQQLFSKEQETIFRKERFRTYKEMDNTNLHSRAMTIGSWNWPFLGRWLFNTILLYMPVYKTLFFPSMFVSKSGCVLYMLLKNVFKSREIDTKRRYFRHPVYCSVMGKSLLSNCY